MKNLSRKIFIGGNWKCNNTLADTRSLVSNVINKLSYDSNKIQVLVCPTTLQIPEVTATLTNKDVLVGAQNVNNKNFGAYTGETAVAHLSDYGVNWTLVGHSERRTLYNETDALVAQKTLNALNNKLSVVLCIGETLEEREAEKTLNVVEGQLNTVASELSDSNKWRDIVVAYEPVWAIGTGKVASPEQAQEVHAFIRKWAGEKLGNEVANQLQVIYGGSVNEKNCAELIGKEDIDGFLIGGASLKPAFKQIVDTCNSQ